MTAKQIVKALIAAGVNEAHILEVRRNEVEIGVLDAETGRCDFDATEALHRKASKALNWGGFLTGYGAWCLRANYQSAGDWNDPSSRWHY